MNLLRVWPGSIRPIKKKQPRTKSSSKSLLLVAAGSETLPIVNSMDEIRRQAVSMSNYGPAPSTLSPTARPRKEKNLESHPRPNS